MTAISIIIPVYNVEKFLPKCLESVLTTSWGAINYEMIVVDDASPDHSLAIAQRYAASNTQIRIISQENKGLGGARNTGLQCALGDYIFFLDSDDYLVGNLLPFLVRKAMESKVDILEFSAVTVREDYSLIKEIFPVKEVSAVTGQTYFGVHHPADSVCNKLYRREFLLSNGMLFMEKVYVEDAPFNVEAYMKAGAAGSFPVAPVAYLQNSSSITRQKRTGYQMTKFIGDSIKVTEKIADFLSHPELQSPARNAVERKLAFFVAGILLMILKSERSEASKLNDLQTLRARKLYPMKYTSGSWARDLFLTAFNRQFLFRVAARFFNAKKK